MATKDWEPELESKTLRGNLRKVVLENPDVKVAAKKFHHWLFRKTSDEIRKRISDELVLAACRGIVEQERGRVRQRYKNGKDVVVPSVSTTPKHSRITGDVLDRSAKTVYLSIMDAWQVGSKVLGDCTQVDLLAAGDRDGKRADGLYQNRAFFYQLGKMMPDPDTTIVRDAIDVDDILEIRDRVWGEAVAV